jgi:hypothetical protein
MVGGLLRELRLLSPLKHGRHDADHEIAFILNPTLFLLCYVTETTVLSRSTEKHFIPDLEPTILCSYSLMLLA